MPTDPARTPPGDRATSLVSCPRCGWSRTLGGFAAPWSRRADGSRCWTTTPRDRRRCTTSTWSPSSSPTRSRPGSPRRSSTCFFLTNTRSLSEADAVELNTRIGRMLFDLATRLGAPIDVVSRSDSTLRGHVIAEVRAGRRAPPGDRPRLRRCADGAGVLRGRPVHRRQRPLGPEWAPTCCRRARPSSRATPPSDTPPPTCATSSPRRVAGGPAGRHPEHHP